MPISNTVKYGISCVACMVLLAIFGMVIYLTVLAPKSTTTPTPTVTDTSGPLAPIPTTQFNITTAPTQAITSAPTQAVTSAPTQAVTSAPTQAVTSAPITTAPTQAITTATVAPNISYLGCYNDKDTRALPSTVDSQNLTQCANIAKQAGSPYFGLQYGDAGSGVGQCWFGSASTTLAQAQQYGANPSGCANMANPPGSAMGGAWVNALYQQNLPITTTAPPVAGTQNISVCESGPVQLTCPTGKKLVINKWQYYRPSQATNCGPASAGCPGNDYAAQANALISNNQFNATGAAAYYPGFSDPCPGVAKQSDVQYSCV